MLWPESDDESARGALRRTLSVLRSALGERWVVADRSAVALDGRRRPRRPRRSSRPPPRRATSPACAARPRWRAARSSPASRSATARTSTIGGRRARSLSSDRSGTCSSGWRRRPRPTGTCPAADRCRVSPARPRSARRAGSAPADGPARAGRRPGRCHPPVPGGGRRPRARAGRRAARGDDGAVRGDPGRPGVRRRPRGPAPISPAAARPAGRGCGRRCRGPAGATRSPADGRARRRSWPRSSTRTTRRRLAAESPCSPARPGSASRGSRRRWPSRSRPRAVASSRPERFAAEGTIAYAPIVELLRAGFADAGRRGRAGRRAAADAARDRAARRPAAARSPATSRPHHGMPAATTSPPRGRGSSTRIATVLVALVAGDIPGMVVVEDLQWADDASREALLFLVRRLDGSPGPRRADVATRGPRRSRRRLRGRRRAVPDVTLAPLRTARARRRRPPGGGRGGPGMATYAVPALVEESEGLPLYVVEALAVGPAAASRRSAARRPRPAPGAPGRRVRDRPASCSRRAPSSGGPSTSRPSATASGRSEDETIVCPRGARPARPRPGGRGRRAGTAFDFGHARLRDAAYEATSLARRRLLHRRVAEVLRAAPDGRDDPGRLALIAGHERAAGRDAEAAEAFREAGARARAVYANREALDHLGTALALGHPDVAGLETMIGELRTALGDYAGAVAALEAAAAVTPDAGLPAIELRLGPGARAARRHGDGGQPPRRGASTSSMAGPSPADPRLLGAILVERSVVAVRSGDLELAGALAARALEVGDGRRRPAGDRRSAATAGPGGEGARRPRRGARRVDAEPRDRRRRPRPRRGDRRAERAGPRRGRRRRPGRGDPAARGGARRLPAGPASCISRPPSRTTSPTSSTRPAGRTRRWPTSSAR